MQRLKPLRKLPCLLAPVIVVVLLAACTQVPEGQANDINFDLRNPPVQKQAGLPLGADLMSDDPGDIYRARCGLCHQLDRGMEKYKGEEWQPIIERMMRKPGSLMNAGIASIIYVYLYERTTGELHPDREALLNPPVDTSGTQDYVGGQ